MINARTYTGLFLFSAATLAFEINLTRIFSVAQFYHFAFLIVSLALLGFGASGTALVIFPNLRRGQRWGSVETLHAAGSVETVHATSLLGGVSMLAAYLLINWLPFDSFSFAWDRRQAAILAVHYLALASPFFFNGLAVGLLLSVCSQSAGQTYAVNLAGAAAGCVIALIAPPRLGGEGIVALCSGLSALAALAGAKTTTKCLRDTSWLRLLLAFGLAFFSFYDFGARMLGLPASELLQLHLSPYKSLSYAFQYPGAQLIFQRWNAFSRVDVVHSAGIRSLPGLSYRYLQSPPPEDGLLVDGDDLSPVVRHGTDTTFANYLPTAIAFRLRPQAEALILEPRGGLDVIAALALGARRVTAVEANPLVVAAASHIYDDPRVSVIVESDRSYLRRSTERFDVIVLSLASSYHPVRSGAYSLAEDYRYTVESFQDALARLRPDGVLVVSRWLQMPPSEELRAFALAVTALERNGNDPAPRIVAFRGYSMITLLVKANLFSAGELESSRAFADARAFDLVYAPDVREEETNRHNVLAESVYYQTFTALLNARSRSEWYADYPFDVEPPTDDRPFFGHFFKWSQAGQVMAELGKTWQPFGGAGYFVLIALLILTSGMAAALILLPLAVAHWRVGSAPAQRGARLVVLIYFALIGVGYLLIEIPLIQRFIVFVGQPAYALTVVLFTLLLFSGLGSRLSAKLPHRPAMAVLIVIVLGLPLILPRIFDLTLALPLWLRLVVSVIVLWLPGFLMGVPFPSGIKWLLETNNEDASPLVAWAWAVNGAASVVASVLAALLALSFGFSAVLMLGAACYAGALITVAVGPKAAAPSRRQ